MLQEICEHIHNYFISGAERGTFVISGGMISLPFLKDGQRFMISGSDLNDGIYTYHDGLVTDDDDSAAVGLHDETWAGTIFALAVPPSVIALSGEIKNWVDKYAETVNSPYLSESFGGYSYTRAQIGRGESSVPESWQQKFANRLNRWRKIAP